MKSCHFSSTFFSAWSAIFYVSLFFKSADDHTVIATISNYLHSLEVNEFLTLVERCYVVNGLILSLFKCKIVNFSLI